MNNEFDEFLSRLTEQKEFWERHGYPDSKDTLEVVIKIANQCKSEAEDVCILHIKKPGSCKECELRIGGLCAATGNAVHDLGTIPKWCNLIGIQ